MWHVTLCDLWPYITSDHMWIHSICAIRDTLNFFLGPSLNFSKIFLGLVSYLSLIFLWKLIPCLLFVPNISECHSLFQEEVKIKLNFQLSPSFTSALFLKCERGEENEQETAMQSSNVCSPPNKVSLNFFQQIGPCLLPPSERLGPVSYHFLKFPYVSYSLSLIAYTKCSVS